MRRLLMTLSICALVLCVAPHRAAAEPAWSRVVIDLSEQHVEVFDASGTRLHRWPASTGAASTPTPTGRFKVTSKSRHTFVRDNPSVTMSYMTRFKGGIGFHGIPRRNGTPLATPLGKRPVSHGCIRLSDVHAAKLFRSLPIGADIIVRR